MNSNPGLNLLALRARFEARVDRSAGPDGCHLWTGSGVRGYGTLRLNGRKVMATHVSVLLATGKLPQPGEVVLHDCDTPACVNPAHLRVGTQTQNVADMLGKGRARPPSTQVAGARNGRAKLSPRDVQAIRATTCTQAQLARQYGVSQSAISLIRSGKTR